MRIAKKKKWKKKITTTRRAIHLNIAYLLTDKKRSKTLLRKTVQWGWCSSWNTSQRFHLGGPCSYAQIFCTILCPVFCCLALPIAHKKMFRSVTRQQLILPLFFFFCTLMGGGAISRSVFFVSKDKKHWKTIFRMLSLAKQAVVLVQQGVIHCWKHSIFMDIVYKMSSSRNTLVPNVVQELLLVATSRRLQHFAVGCKVVGSITNSISMKAECKTARVPYQALYACLRTPDGQT